MTIRLATHGDTARIYEIRDNAGDGEVRIIAIGEIAGRVFTCVYTRRGEAYRPISLRPAHRKERHVYREAKAQNDESGR